MFIHYSAEKNLKITFFLGQTQLNLKFIMFELCAYYALSSNS